MDPGAQQNDRGLNNNRTRNHTNHILVILSILNSEVNEMNLTELIWLFDKLGVYFDLDKPYFGELC